MNQNFEKLKDYLSRFEKNHFQEIKTKAKRIIVWIFITLLGFGVIFSGFFFYFYLNWQTDRGEILKQAEIYYNQILKETRIFTRYKTIGGKDYLLKNVEEPIRVLDYRGELLGEFSNEKRSFVALDEVSPYFFYALFATEDIEFYNHTGINYKAILRAVIKNIVSLKLVEGGSTLTQQLSKILFTDRQRNIKRKIYEFFCARELEEIYTKEDILLMYVNLIFLGHGAYGVEYASQLFFKKPAKDLTLGESTLLVGVISNPTLYSPFLNRENAIRKHRAVLGRMEKTGYISEKTSLNVHESFWKNHCFKKEELVKGKQIIRSNKAPYVVEEVRRFLMEKYGEGFFVKNKGASIYTTIDKRLQSFASQVFSNHLKYLRTIASKKLKKKEKERIQGAVLFSVPKTGEIRVLLGGDGFDVENQLNRAFQARRQVGSTLKPFLYLSGLENKVITPYTIFEDKPITIEIENAPEDQKYWQISNYNNEYKGYLTVTEALYRSSNVVAAQVAYRIGVDGLKRILRDILRLSVQEADKRFPSYQYSLSLGATEMTPLEVNTLFMALANQGEAVKPYLISKIIDKSRVIYEAPQIIRKRVVSKESAFLLINMMRQVLGPYGTAGWVKTTYNIDFDVAGKTGTTQENRDTWFNGINPSLAGTVWIGQDDNLVLGKNFTGGGAAAPIWAMIMKKAATLYDMGAFSYDQTYALVRQPVCLLSGKVPKEGNCTFTEENALFIEGTEPGEYCDLSEGEHRTRAMLKGWTDSKKEKEEQFSATSN